MCFDVSEVVLSGTVSVIVQLIREWSPFKAGVGDPQCRKENKHKSCTEQSECLCWSTNLGVPRDLAGVNTGTSREKSPQGVVDWTLCLSARQPIPHQTAAPKKTVLGLSLCYAMKHSYLVTGVVPQLVLHPCLYSVPNLLAPLPVPCC